MMNEILDMLKSPWHWSIAGILVGLTVPILLLLGNKHFGISANLRHVCAACLPANIPFFKYDWRKERWNFFFIGGTIFGLGWALTGACPGPLFAQIGTGVLVVGVTLLSAIVGTWVYGYFREKLPH